MTFTHSIQGCIWHWDDRWYDSLSTNEVTLEPLFTKQTRSYRKISWRLKSARFGFRLSNRSEIWQSTRQQRCQCACQISEWYDHYNIQSRGSEISQDLIVRRPSAIYDCTVSRIPVLTCSCHAYCEQTNITRGYHSSNCLFVHTSINSSTVVLRICKSYHNSSYCYFCQYDNDKYFLSHHTSSRPVSISSNLIS